jgi:hypothetical protein
MENQLPYLESAHTYSAHCATLIWPSATQEGRVRNHPEQSRPIHRQHPVYKLAAVPLSGKTGVLAPVLPCVYNHGSQVNQHQQLSEQV